MHSNIPSESLLGLTLNNDWEVIGILKKDINSTGGLFSTGYKVKKKNQVAYLKAIDFSPAFRSSDIPRELQALTEAYNFERDLLYQCKEKRLSKVVIPIDNGSIEVPGLPQYINIVYYIIFDLADGDIRKIKNTFSKFDFAFVFRSLHNTAVGLRQLHKSGIAHQDLKPSNVLVFNNISKIGDLGRASAKNIPFKYDKFAIPGDMTYAPIEQLYNYHFSGDFNEKYAADLYLLGSLFFFFFTGISASEAILNKIKKNRCSLKKSFKCDLPEIKKAFSDVLHYFIEILDQYKFKKEDKERIMILIKCLCEPDPEERGYFREISINQYSLERVISSLDILAKKAEFNIL